MSADLLHEAAALIRRRVGAVTSEHRIEQTLLRGVVRCSCGESSVGDPCWARAHLNGLAWSVSRDYATQVWDERERLVASAEGLDEAAHIAAADPPFMLAVADWLESVAERHVPMGHPMFGVLCCASCNLDLEGDERGHCDDFDDALAAARAYLGRDA